MGLDRHWWVFCRQKLQNLILVSMVSLWRGRTFFWMLGSDVFKLLISGCQDLNFFKYGTFGFYVFEPRISGSGPLELPSVNKHVYSIYINMLENVNWEYICLRDKNLTKAHKKGIRPQMDLQSSKKIHPEEASFCWPPSHYKRIYIYSQTPNA